MSEARGGRTRSDEEPAPEPEAERRAGDPEPDGGSHGHGHECLEWCPICRSVELLRGANTPEVRQQLQAIQNEAMQVFRAFAAAYSERSGEDPFARRRDDQAPAGGRDPDPAKPAASPIDISIE